MFTTRDYVIDPTLFRPVWAGTWSSPRWLMDFSEKARLMEEHGGRLMSFAHRADCNRFYPENSLEAVLSCIAMGVDVLELDVRMTGDGGRVMSHDNTMTRCTNVAEMRALYPGRYPDSDRYYDWTIDQVRELRLIGVDGKPSEYRVAEFSDVLQVCSGRIMMILDKLEETAAEDGKTEEQWREVYLEPLLAKYDSVPSCVKGWHFAMENNWILGDYRAGCTEKWQQIIDGPAAGKNLEAGTLPREFDDLQHWMELESMGIDYIMTNHPMELIRYIAEKYAP